MFTHTAHYYGGADAAAQDAMHRYGLHLGYAFQIADDVLDYASDAATMGKNLGDDLSEGKMTLPLIHAMRQADAPTRARLRAIVETGDVAALEEVTAAIAHSVSLDYSRAAAMRHAELAEGALEGLGDTQAFDALRGLARYSVERDR